MSMAGRSPAIFAVAIVALVVLYFAYSVAEILLLLFIATLFALYLGLLTDFFHAKLAIPRALGLVLALLATLAGITLLVMLIVPPLAVETQGLLNALPSMLQAGETRLLELAQRNALIGQLLGPLPEGQSYIESMMQEIRGYFAGLVPYVFGGMRFLIHFVSVLVMGIYLCLRPSLYREGLVSLFPTRRRPLARDILADLSHTLRAWIVGQALAMTVLGVLTWLGLLFLRVPYALAFGVFTGLAAIVPFFGTLVSTLLPALVVLSTDGLIKALAVILLGTAIHLIEANLVAPMIMEKKVDLPPVLTLLSVLIMAHLLHVVGLLVAVPVLATVVVLVRRVYILLVLEARQFRSPAQDRVAEGGGQTGTAGSVKPAEASMHKLVDSTGT
ncbi:MAG: AI-2E family transporter [Gemmatimonadetes bacterium]|nr:AI-2E family transporter [Gemmatimonadota bacterium]